MSLRLYEDLSGLVWNSRERSLVIKEGPLIHLYVGTIRNTGATLSSLPRHGGTAELVRDLTIRPGGVLYLPLFS